MKKFFFPAVLAVVIFCSFGVGKTTNYHSVFTSSLLDTGGLPDSYKNRHFMNDLLAFTNDMPSVPGNLVKWSPATSAYEIITLKAIVKGGKPAMAQPISNPLIYKGRVSETSSLNGSGLIADLKADKGQVIDLEIRDDASYAVPDGQIDTAAIRAAVQSISPDDLKNLYYITSVTVSVINYKIHAAEKAPNKLKSEIDKLQKPDTSKKGLHLNAKKSKSPAPFSTSGSDTRMLTDKTLSIQITPLADITGPAHAAKK